MTDRVALLHARQNPVLLPNPPIPRHDDVVGVRNPIEVRPLPDPRVVPALQRARVKPLGELSFFLATVATTCLVTGSLIYWSGMGPVREPRLLEKILETVPHEGIALALGLIQVPVTKLMGKIYRFRPTTPSERIRSLVLGTKVWSVILMPTPLLIHGAFSVIAMCGVNDKPTTFQSLRAHLTFALGFYAYFKIGMRYFLNRPTSQPPVQRGQPEGVR